MLVSGQSHKKRSFREIPKGLNLPCPNTYSREGWLVKFFNFRIQISENFWFLHHKIVFRGFYFTLREILTYRWHSRWGRYSCQELTEVNVWFLECHWSRIYLNICVLRSFMLHGYTATFPGSFLPLCLNNEKDPSVLDHSNLFHGSITVQVCWPGSIAVQYLHYRTSCFRIHQGLFL